MKYGISLKIASRITGITTIHSLFALGKDNDSFETLV